MYVEGYYDRPMLDSILGLRNMNMVESGGIELSLNNIDDLRLCRRTSVKSTIHRHDILKHHLDDPALVQTVPVRMRNRVEAPKSRVMSEK